MLSTVPFLLFNERLNAASLEPSLPAQLNGNSSFPHWNTLGKSVSGELDFHWFPVNRRALRQTDLGFEFSMSQKPREPYSGEISLYRLLSNHCRPRETVAGFEFATSKYP